MTARVERFDHPAPSFAALAAERMLALATAIFVRWWQRPTELVMSDEWLSEHARSVSKRGWH
jgi:hypothetical protein